MLFAEDKGKTWILLRGRLAGGDQFSGNDALLPLMAQSRHTLRKTAETLSGGGALFAAVSKAAAEKESRLMSMVGLD